MVGRSWPRTLAAAIVVVCVAGLLVAFVFSGRLVNARFWSFPGHPYPPSGYYVNPFNTRDQSDLIKTADAARVKADLLEDGRTELLAVAQNDPSLLGGSTTGNALSTLQQLIGANTRDGVTERQDIQLDSVTVGRLADPNNPHVRWCVEEVGRGLITRMVKQSGSPVSTQALRFDNRFWLVWSGSRYLITDVSINIRPR